VKAAGERVIERSFETNNEIDRKSPLPEPILMLHIHGACKSSTKLTDGKKIELAPFK
jgi:hypothetical protein